MIVVVYAGLSYFFLQEIAKDSIIHSLAGSSRSLAVITGSTKGNGRATANLFSEQGANVVVIGRDKSEAQSIAYDLIREYKTSPLGLKVYVTSATEVIDMIELE